MEELTSGPVDIALAAIEIVAIYLFGRAFSSVRTLHEVVVGNVQGSKGANSNAFIAAPSKATHRRQPVRNQRRSRR